MAGTDPRHNKFIIAVTVDNETAAIKVGDAIPVDLGQSKSFTCTAPLMRAGHREPILDSRLSH